jgi:hypothetical protein
MNGPTESFQLSVSHESRQRKKQQETLLINGRGYELLASLLLL